jgi:N-acetylneuraminic acid mutarotase
MPTRIIPFQQGMKLGFGYDLLEGSPLTTPSVQGTVSAIRQAQGQNVISSIVTITDINTLYQELGVNVDAGGSYFGVSADVKVNYAEECNVSHFATHVMARVSVQDAFENFDAPVLTDDAKALLTGTGDLASTRFRQRFGDLFIDGLQKGGEYFATWEIVSVDQSVRQAIATKVEAAFRNPLAAAHLDVDVDSAKASTSSHTEVHVHVLQKGASDQTDQTMEEVLAKAHDFPPSVAGDKAVAFAVSIADYKTLNLPIDGFNFLDIQNQRDVLAEHARKRFEFLALRNSISYIRQHPEDFIGADDTKLADELSKITDAINIMETEASACLRDAKQCKFTAFDISSFPLPPARPPLPSDGTWVVKQPLPAVRFDFGLGAASNGKLYAVGGFEVQTPATTMEEYDPGTNSWATKTPPPQLFGTPVMVAADNGKLYAIDGSVREYDPTTDSWTIKAPMLTPRGDFGLAAGRNGKFYAVGGSVLVHGSPTGPIFDHFEPIPNVDEYDPATDRWTAKTPLKTARAGASLVAATNGKLYAVGGSSLINGHVTATTDLMEEYDLSTDSWTTKEHMPTVRNGFAVAAAGNGKLYAVGGTINGEDALHLVEEYDPATNNWVAKAPMPTARHRLALAAASNGKLYAVGGIIQFQLAVTHFANVEEFTP